MARLHGGTIMATKILWRVETKDGCGIFASEILDHFDFYNGDDKNYPSMMTDMGVQYSESTRSACIDVNQLKHWFSKKAVIDWLSAHKAVIVLYECPEEFVIEGRTQVLFTHRRARMLETLPIALLPIL